MDQVDEGPWGDGYRSLSLSRQRTLSVDWCRVSLDTTDKEQSQLLDDTQAAGPSRWRETGEAIRIALFIAASQCCRMALFSTDQAFVGRIGKAEIAGAALSRNWISLTSTPISGAVASLNTLCAQAVGAGNARLAGTWVQLVSLVCLVLAVPTICSFFFVDRIMENFVPTCSTSDVCHLAGTFSKWTSLTIAPMVLCKVIYVYFQAIGVVSSAFWTSLLVIAVNVCFNWLFVFGLWGFGGLGFIGSPIATTCSVLVQVSTFWLWTITYKQSQRVAWGGWALREALAWRRLRDFLSQAGPAMLSLSLDRWAYSILALLVARYLDPTTLAAHSVLNTIWGLVWSFNHGIAISTQIGVSLNLGKQRLARAQFRASLGVVMNAVMMGLLATVLWFGRAHVGTVWSRSDEVVACVADTMFAYLCSALMASFVLILERILDGMAYANLVAWVSALGQPWVLVLLASGYLQQQEYGDRLITVWYLCAATGACQALLLLLFISCLTWDGALLRATRMTERAAAERASLYGPAEKPPRPTGP